MFRERLQILVTKEQRRLLEGEAGRRGTSVASVIRELVDGSLGGVAVGERERAVSELRAMSGRFLDPDQLNGVVSAERLDQLDPLLKTNAR